MKESRNECEFMLCVVRAVSKKARSRLSESCPMVLSPQSHGQFDVGGKQGKSQEVDTN